MEPDGGTGDALAAASPTDAGVLESRCGTTSLLRDDFADDRAGALWYPWSGSGVSAVETGGRLQIRLAAGSANTWAGYTSTAAFDLRGGALTVTVLRTGGVYTVLEVRSHHDIRARLLVDRGTLRAAVVDPSNLRVGAETAYDPVQHRLWRLREANGMLYWETSPDRAGWTVLHVEPVPLAAEHVYGILAAGGQLPSASEAWFDDLNLPADGALGYCPASTLREGFDDALGPSWAGWAYASCTTTVIDGALELHFPGSGSSWCGATSTHLYDLRDDAVAVEAMAPGLDNFTAYFKLISLDREDTVEVHRYSASLVLQMRRRGATAAYASLPYDAVMHRYWRIRESDGGTFWDTSADGTTWTSRLSAPTAVDVSAVFIELGAGHESPGPGQPVVTRYDHLNTR